MAVVTLTFTGSEQEITSGIPQTVAISSSDPATIYFTIDGSTPTINSPIYTGPFEMPSGFNSVMLSAFGVDGLSVSGPILTQTFAPDVTRVSVSRHVGGEGFIISKAETGDDIPDWYDADGATARFIDVDLETLDVIRSEQGFEGLVEGTAIEVNVPDPSSTASLVDDGFELYSTPEVGEFFNPNARMINIDTRKDNELNPTLRPFGGLHDPYSEFGGKRVREPADDATYISGGFVRRFYDTRNNVMVSYYFDHNEARYIKNIQELPANIKNTNNIGIQANGGQPLVFEWLPRGRQSSI